MSPLDEPTRTPPALRASAPREALAFARAMRETGELADPSLVLDFFEAPWKWAREFEVWRRCGSPSVDDELAFEAFADVVMAGEHRIREWLLSA